LIFSISEWDVLNKLVNKTPHIASIRHLRLEINIGLKIEHETWESVIVTSEHIRDISAFQSWQGALQMVIQKMKQLQHLHLDVEQDMDREPAFLRKVEDGGGDEVT